jgi:hypothetical protein
MMVALGCNVYKNCITGAGPKMRRKIMVKLKDAMANTEQDREEYLFHALLDHTATATRIGIKTVDTLAKSIICKPTNYASYDYQDLVKPTAEHIYFDGLCPTKLPTYLSNFGSSGDTIIDEDGPTVIECTSVGDPLHLFFESFGLRTCFLCNQIC